MDSRRQQKIGSVLREALSEIFTRDGKGIYGSAFVTVTSCKVSSDLTLARFYLSIFNEPNKESIIQKIEAKQHDIKKMLSEKLRFQLRRIPEFEYFVDDTLDEVFKMEELFKKIHDEKK